jgi:CD63 antigen
MSDLSGGAKCIKYTLFFFNFLFLLAALALIIVGSIVQYQSSKYATGSVSGVGIFVIVVGVVLFIICFFGCAGAINDNYCMVTTYGVLLLIVLVLEIAAIIAGFVQMSKVEPLVQAALEKDIQAYTAANSLVAEFWNSTQATFKCCGTYNYTAWRQSSLWGNLNSVPDQCCISFADNCGRNTLNDPTQARFSLYQKGCVTLVVDAVKSYTIAAAGIAVVVAIIELIGVIFAFCLVHQLRRQYSVV